MPVLLASLVDELDVDAPVPVELADDDELAVMAVQRADGELARDEARRLAGLVERHRAS